MSLPIGKMISIGILPSTLKKLYYRAKGAKIGKNVTIGLFSYINANYIEIGNDTIISAFSFINARSIKLGKRVKLHSFVAIDTGVVEIDDDTVIMEQVVVGGMLTPRSKLKIGKRVKVFPYSFLNPTENILIEDDVGIGGANYIFTHGSWQSILDGFPVKFGPVTIKRGAWFPWRVFVMPGITVGEYATIGAGSTITKDIPPRSLAVGVPAKVIKQESEYIKKLDDNAKDKIMLNIMNEFTDYLNYIDYMATLHKEDRFTFIKVKKKHITNTISYKYKYNVLPASDIFISLSKFDESLITQLINANKIWFDIERRQCCYSSDSLWLETMNFLSRYGIRFNVFDK